ncbi:MAG: hypothetical protein AAF618_09700 [Pseudomonadota bacterium]
MAEGAAVQSELQCHACGGQTRFDPTSGVLKCESCGTERAIAVDPAINAAAEHIYDADKASPEPARRAQGRTHKCQTCGGAVTFHGAALSERCAYCNGPMVRIEGDAAFAAMALIPFKVPSDAAVTAMKAWTKRRLAAPSDLFEAVEAGRVAALYAPFFTFDSLEALQYWGSYRVHRKNSSTIRSVSGRFQATFDDLLVPASPHVTPLLRDGMLHEFDPRALKPFAPDYLAGFAAEHHHLTVAEGLKANAADKALLIRNRIQRHAGRKLSDLRYETDTSDIRYRRILLPVHILHYEYEGKPYRLVCCGLEGRAYGERPFSRWKIMGYATAISTLAFGLGAVWGALGWL